MTSTQSDRMDPVMDDRIRVLLVDGHALFRQAVRVSLGEAPDIMVVGEALDAAGCVPEIEHLRPDVVLVDALEATVGAGRVAALIKEHAPNCRLIVLGDEDADTLLDVIEAGASGYVTQRSALTELIETTRAVARGDVSIPQSLIGPLVSGLMERRREELEAFKRLAQLTHREREVLELLATGANNHGIARVLSISPETARTHVQNLLSKLGMHSRLEAAAFVVQTRPLVSTGGSR